MAQTFAYVLASADPEVESTAVQTAIIKDYSRRIGRQIDVVFTDDADAGWLHLIDREAGKSLLTALGKGDHVVVAGIHRMFVSFTEFGETLGRWAALGVVLHLCNVPQCPLDPENAFSRLMIQFILTFAGQKRHSLSIQNRQALARLKAEGRRCSRHAPYGFRWEKRGQHSYQVPEPGEQQLCIRMARLYMEGYSFHQIREFLAYSARIKNRMGKAFGYTEVRKMVYRGAQFLHDEALQQA